MYFDNLLSRLISIFIGLAEIILGLRVIFRLFNANPNAALVNWIYQTSSVLMQPFRGVFSAQVISSGYTLDISALFAMLMYAIIGTIVIALLSFLPAPAERHVVRRQDLVYDYQSVVQRIVFIVISKTTFSIKCVAICAVCC